MTSVLRRGGSAVAFSWDQHAIPSSLRGQLQAHRFRSIETAASEEVSVGWVTPGDPTGDSFVLEDMDAGGHWWLRFRVDAKKFPASKLQVEIANAERARGKRLSARERRELKDDLHEKLLPSILPRTQFFDVLVHRDLHTALLLSTSKAAQEAFGKLCRDALGFEPKRLTSGAIATRTQGEQSVGKLMPTVFPGSWRCPLTSSATSCCSGSGGSGRRTAASSSCRTAWSASRSTTASSSRPVPTRRRWCCATG